MKKTNNKGFSLVELIVVIAIMAVMVGVLAPTFTKYVEKSRKSTDVQNVASIITAVQTYVADPSVASGERIGAGAHTITLEYGKDPVCSGNVGKALTAAGVSNVQLKSNDWKVTGTGATAGKVVLTITVKDDYTMEIKSDCDITKNDILKGNY